MIHKHDVPVLQIMQLTGWIHGLFLLASFSLYVLSYAFVIVFMSTASLPESAATEYKAALLDSA